MTLVQGRVGHIACLQGKGSCMWASSNGGIIPRSSQDPGSVELWQWEMLTVVGRRLGMWLDTHSSFAQLSARDIYIHFCGQMPYIRGLSVGSPVDSFSFLIWNQARCAKLILREAVTPWEP